MPAFSIRIASLHDLESLAILFDGYRQFYQQSADMDVARRFIESRLKRRDSIILVAIDHQGKPQEALIGFCQIYPSFCSVITEKIGVLYDLFVDGAARKSGAGKALMLAAHGYANDHGFARLDLTTAKSNTPAQSLYESLGWTRDDVFYSYSKVI